MPLADVAIHIKYTAREDAAEFRQEAFRLASKCQARWEEVRLKTRWTVKGPCRFESGHRQIFSGKPESLNR